MIRHALPQQYYPIARWTGTSHRSAPVAPRPAPLAAGRPAWHPIALIAATQAAFLLATATRYGYERDELYFRMLAAHPAWGYVDQPPATPMLAKAGIALLGDNLWALRVPALLCATGTVVLVALLARELGGGHRAQALAAATAAGSGFVLVAGHTLLTASADLLVWLGLLLFAVRALMRNDPRCWVAAGAVAGGGLYNKQLVVLLALALAAGLLAAGPRAHLRSRWLWAGVAVAVVVDAPNLLYQVTHGWPQLHMAHAIAADKGHDDLLFFGPYQLVLLGLTVTPVWIAGLVRLIRDRRFTRVRAVGIAYPVLAVLVLTTRGQPYYTAGLLLALLAAGSVAAEEWATTPARRAWLAGAVAVSAAVGVLFALPVYPVRSLPAAVAAADQAARDSVGWPAYVREVAAVYRSLPPDEQAHAVVLTDNYGEAGAIARYGAAYALPALYSGQNELYRFGPPPASTTTVVEVGISNETHFAACTVVTHLDDGVGVTNEEQGRPISICRHPLAPWPQLWPRLQHYG